MKAQKFLVMAASVLIFSACGAPPKPTPAPQAVTPPPPKLNLEDAEVVAGASSVLRDEYGKATTYRGPNLANKPHDQLFIRALKTDFGSVAYQIYIVINYSGVWRFYNSALDAKDNTLDVAAMNRNLDKCQLNNCSHREQLIIDVTKKYLEENMQNGLRLRVSGKAGNEEEFFIPAGYIKAFLSMPDKSR